MSAQARIVPILIAALALPGCGSREDPARVALRARLAQETRLSDEELGRTLDEVSRAIAGKTIRSRQGNTTNPLNQEQGDTVIGMLADRAGVYDEGLRTEGAAKFRIINAPGKSINAEYEATRRLWIDVETFLPRHFEFSYGVAGIEGYSFDLVVGQGDER